jgi:hypothetical protein
MKSLRKSRSTLVLIGAVWFAGHAQNAAAVPAVYEPGADPSVGFNLIEWYNFPSGGEQVWQDSIQSMYDAGFHSVSISPVRFVNVTTGTILATSPKGPEMSHITAAVVKAKSLGMHVTLNPFVEMYNPHGQSDPNDFEYFSQFNGCGWRGCFNLGAGTPENAQFWSDYQGYLSEIATLAESHSVDAMIVGTEYNQLNYDPNQNGNWNTAINAVDAIYHGKLGYAANWDVYSHGNVQDSIWEHAAIDFVGIDSYFNYGNDVLTTYFRGQNPALSQDEAIQMSIAAGNSSGQYPNPSFIDLMTAAWNYKLDQEILPYAAALKGGAGMPVRFTEVGYLPRNLTAVDPQHQYLTGFLGNQPADADEQVMAFQGLINALDGRKDVFEGMHIWQWGIPGSDGSQWNIDPTLPADQPSNLALAQWLSAYVNTVPEPTGLLLTLVGFATLGASSRRRINLSATFDSVTSPCDS